MRTQVLHQVKKTLLLSVGVVLILAGTAWAESATSADNKSESNRVVRTYGAEGGYLTEVTSETQGALSEDDPRQVAVLTAQIFHHISQAQRSLEADNSADADVELEKGRKAIKAIRAMLPTTIIHTRTSAPDGAVVYEDKREIQEDRVPLFEGMLSTKTLAPLVKAKEDAQEYFI